MPMSHQAFVFDFAAFEAAGRPGELARFYDAAKDIGLGLTWQRYRDVRAVLGTPLGARRATFELGTYVQSPAEIEANLQRLAASQDREHGPVIEMLEQARGHGLLVRF